MSNLDEYSHAGFLDSLSPELAEAVRKFLATGDSCELLRSALDKSPELLCSVTFEMSRRLKENGQI